MAAFSVEIPDEFVGLVITALCTIYGRPEDSELTEYQFANKVCRDFIKEVVTAYAVKQAESALQAARESVAGVEIIDPSLES